MWRSVRRSLILLSLCVLLGCGDDRPSNPREAAEAFVAAMKARDWKAACAVSVNDGIDECTKVLRYVSENGGQVPTVDQTEKLVRKVDGRYLVHAEFAVIR